jgi:hypothetical protein
MIPANKKKIRYGKEAPLPGSAYDNDDHFYSFNKEK